MNIHFLRHATLVVSMHGKNILVDPMFSPKDTMDPIPNAGNDHRIPMVDLPVSDDELQALIGGLDAVLVTHIHRDHWDTRAIELLPKDIPLICQPADPEAFTKKGFTSVTAVEDEYSWEGIHFFRTGGHHGKGKIEELMGTVSGFVLRAENEPSLYIAGDTIWCKEVGEALNTHLPDAVILNAGAAQFLETEPITMDAADVSQVCKTASSAKIIPVHMEVINHCLLTRDMLRDHLEKEGLVDQAIIPADGERFNI